LESTDKYQRVSEAAETLESAEDTVQEALYAMEEHDLDWDCEVEYSYLKPYGRKPMSRYDRLGEATSLLAGAQEALEERANEVREEAEQARKDADAASDAVTEAEEARDEADEKGDAEAKAKAEAEVKAAEKSEQEAEEKAEKAEEKVEAIAEAIEHVENSSSECDGVDFPGMFG
jgi:hypothetical protein